MALARVAGGVTPAEAHSHTLTFLSSLVGLGTLVARLFHALRLRLLSVRSRSGLWTLLSLTLSRLPGRWASPTAVPARAGKKQAVDTPSSDAVGRELDALADEADAFVRAQRTLGGKGKGKAARWADSEDDDEDL